MTNSETKRIEREWKYKITTRDEFLRIIRSSVRYDTKIKNVVFEENNNERRMLSKELAKKTGIIQWYLEDTDEFEHRIRLEIRQQPTGFVLRWIETTKKSTDKEEEREENERTLENLDDIIKQLKTKKMVAKIRYTLLDDPEVVVDEFLFPTIDGFILEIEQKSDEKPINFDNLNFLRIKHLSKDETKKYKNKNIAQICDLELNEIISFVQNRMKERAVVVLALGASTKAFKEDRTTKFISEDTANLNNITTIFSENFSTIPTLKKSTEKEAKNDNSVGLSAELETLSILSKKGYCIKDIILFTNEPHFAEGKYDSCVAKRHEDLIKKIKEKEKDGLKVKFLSVKDIRKGDEPIINLEESSKSFKDIPLTQINAQTLYNLYSIIDTVNTKIGENINIYIIDTHMNPENVDSALNLYRDVVKIMNSFSLKEEYKNSEFIMDVASGLRIFGVILTMWGIFNNKDIYMKYERQQDLIRIPRIAVDWDMNYIDSIAATLEQLVFQEDGNELPLYRLLKLPDEVANLYNFENDQKAVLFYDIKEIRSEYREKRKMPFGYGEKLLNVFDNKDLRDYIEEGIIEKWSYMWIGDQIPETVEHSQRHSKRLMEFTITLLNKMGEDFFLAPFGSEALYREYITGVTYRDLLYFILITAMNVHDLGHTYPKYKIPGTNTTIYIDSLPSAVRDLHNELTVQLIDDEAYDILAIKKPFSSNSKSLTELFREKTEEVKKAIQAACKYHRGYLKIDNDDIGENNKSGSNNDNNNFVKIFKVNTESLTETLQNGDFKIEDELLREIVIFVARWLRFIDGTDVQADRIITDAYHKSRVLRTKEECEYLYEKLKTIKDSDYEISEQIESLIQKIKIINIDELSNIDGSINDAGGTIENKIYDRINSQLETSEQVHIPLYLEIANKIAFKSRQFKHFDKHKSVANVYVSDFKFDLGTKEAKLIIEVIPNIVNESRGNADILKGIKEDICEEFTEARLFDAYKNLREPKFVDVKNLTLDIKNSDEKCNKKN